MPCASPFVMHQIDMASSNSVALSLPRRLLTREFIRRLRALLDWFEHQDQLEFISAPLLLVYTVLAALLAPSTARIIDSHMCRTCA